MFNYNAEFDNESIAVTYYKTVYLLLRAMMNKVSHMEFSSSFFFNRQKNILEI